MKNKEKIGIGIVTYNRPDYLKKCISCIPFHKVDECIVVKDGGGLDYDISSNDDFHYHEYKENGGNCRSKNKIFKYLLEKGCKHIFLIEDDMLIQDENIFDIYIDTANKTGVYHLMYLKVADNVKHKRLTVDNLDLHKNPQGSFMYALDSVVKHVGDWDLNFKNAFTHIDWTYRVIQKGLMPPFWWFPDVKDSEKLLIEIPGSTENSSITDKGHYKKNWQDSANYWVEKYGYFTNTIPDSTKEQVIERLKFLKKNYAR
tara:strand:- start:5118 stop:5891 length:774 start_codon:yes stop_codon:yes gene_type:complete